MFFLVLLAFGCKKENEPPVIEGITAMPNKIKKGDPTQISCVAKDPEGGELTYSWSSDKGSFLSGTDEATVTWKAPEAAGTYVISVTVSDGPNRKEGTVTITVVEINYGIITDARDGRTYKTILIGNQVWMAENLAYLPAVSPSSPGSQAVPYYYVYGYQGTNVVTAKQQTNYSIFGVLYNWSAAMDGSPSSSANPSGVRGACPAGWHLPSDAEWEQLENYLADNGYNYDGSNGGGRDKIGKSLASTTYWDNSTGIGDIGNNLSVNNVSGFSALPGGNRDTYWSSFNYIGKSGNWWSSTEMTNTHILYRRLDFDQTTLINSNNVKDYGSSVRCVRD